MYHIDQGKAHFDEKLLFQNRELDVLFAKVAMRGTESDRLLKAQVWLTNGHIFSITFDRPPVLVSGGFSVTSAQVLVDPEQPTTVNAIALDPRSLSGKLAEWHRTWGLVDVRPALGEEEQRKRTQDLEIVVPSDYKEMLKMSDGFNIAGWRIHGLAEIRSVIVDSEDTLFVLAENDDFGCLVASSQHPDKLRLIHYDGPTVEETEKSFIAAMEKLLKCSGRGAIG